MKGQSCACVRLCVSRGGGLQLTNDVQSPWHNDKILMSKHFFFGNLLCQDSKKLFAQVHILHDKLKLKSNCKGETVPTKQLRFAKSDCTRIFHPLTKALMYCPDSNPFNCQVLWRVVSLSELLTGSHERVVHRLDHTEHSLFPQSQRADCTGIVNQFDH